MNKRILAAIAAIALSLGGVVTTTTVASATTTECVPSEGTAAYDETVVDAAAVDLWYSWTGGPSDDHAFPGEDWQVDNGNHNGFDQSPGLLQRDKGKSGQSDWFYHQVIAEQSRIVHHDAVDPVVCDPAEQPHHEIALYCYDKLNPDLPAAWDNSGYQTLVATKLGDADWTLAEKRVLCDSPEESCTPGSHASQSDWGNVLDAFEWPEHITYPTDNIGWPPLYNAVHTDLTQSEPEGGCQEVVTVSPGTPVVKDLCAAADDHYGLLADTADIAYTRDGLDIIATITSDAIWGTLPTGWVDNGDGTATYPFSATEWTHVNCPLPPDSYTRFGEIVEDEYGCGDTTVDRHQSAWHTTYSNNEDGSVEETTVEGTISDTRDLTAEEIAALDCPTSTPTPPTGRLPYTGDNAGVVGPIGAGVLLAGILAAVGAGIARRRSI